MKVRVKTTWQGKVGINEKYVHEASRSGKGLEIWVGSEVMEIPVDEVTHRIVSKTDKPFRDRFGKTPPYHLYYYNWKPTVSQNKLL